MLFKKPPPKEKIYYQKPTVFEINTLETLKNKKQWQLLIERIRQLVHVDSYYWDLLYLPMLENYLCFCQQLPAILYPKFNKTTGLIRVGFRRIIDTLLLYRENDPIKKTKFKNIASKESITVYAITSACLFYNLGVVPCMYWVSLCDLHGFSAKRWNPFLSSMDKNATFFRLAFESQENTERLHAYTSTLLARKYMPEIGFEYLTQDKDLFEKWLLFLNDDIDRGGIIHDMISPFEVLYYQPQDFFSLFQTSEDMTAYLQPMKEPNVPASQEDHLHHMPHESIETPIDDMLGPEKLANYFLYWLRIALQGRIPAIKLHLNKPNTFLHMTKEGLLCIKNSFLETFTNLHNLDPQKTLEKLLKTELLQEVHVTKSPAQQTRQLSSFQSQNSKTQENTALLLDPSLIFKYLPRISHEISVEIAQLQHISVLTQKPEKK